MISAIKQRIKLKIAILAIAKWLNFKLLVKSV